MKLQVSIRCPWCGRGSYHPEDVRQCYCGACHRFHDEAQRTAAATAQGRSAARGGTVVVRGGTTPRGKGRI